MACQTAGFCIAYLVFIKVGFCGVHSSQPVTTATSPCTAHAGSNFLL